MPELPEVETMVRGIRPALVGRTFLDVTVHDSFLLKDCRAQVFERRARGAVVERVDRRGKWVVMVLEQARGIIVIQPRMTGGFWLVEPERPDHIRLSFRLNGSCPNVWYCDTRRLGQIRWFAGVEEAQTAFEQSQGPDALEITQAQLSAGLRRTARGIKPALMDQKIVAGIGNIYADEIVFRARIHPERPASALKPKEIARIREAIGTVLNEAIVAEGSSFDGNYRTVLGREGGFLVQNAMYGRGGQPCPACGGPVLKTKIAGLVGRPTHYCPRCQPRPRRRNLGSRSVVR
jgi:formamidopyrimidine-DNA glycosylase